MNAIHFSKHFPWLPALGILTFSGALFLCNWLVWTPIERYYLGTYLKCALLGTDRGSSAEVQWLYKTAPHGKQELAQDADEYKGYVVRVADEHGGEIGTVPVVTAVEDTSR